MGSYDTGEREYSFVSVILQVIYFLTFKAKLGFKGRLLFLFLMEGAVACPTLHKMHQITMSKKYVIPIYKRFGFAKGVTAQ